MNETNAGGVRWIRGKPYYRAQLLTGKRPAVALAVDADDKDAADERARLIGEVIAQLRNAGRPEYEEHWLRKIAGATHADELDGYLIAARAICAGTTLKKPKLTGAMTFREFGEMWTLTAAKLGPTPSSGSVNRARSTKRFRSLPL